MKTKPAPRSRQQPEVFLPWIAAAVLLTAAVAGRGDEKRREEPEISTLAVAVSPRERPSWLSLPQKPPIAYATEVRILERVEDWYRVETHPDGARRGWMQQSAFAPRKLKPRGGRAVPVSVRPVEAALASRMIRELEEGHRSRHPEVSKGYARLRDSDEQPDLRDPIGIDSFRRRGGLHGLEEGRS